MIKEELDDDGAFLEKFKRDPTAPRPDWALKPDSSGSLESALESVPLFMQNTCPTADQIDSNPTLQALQTLLYDEQEKPEERANNFKNQGNEAYREKRLRDAVKFYTSGLREVGISELLRSQLYGNRSAVWWTMERWTDCLNDCKMVINSGEVVAEKIMQRAIKCAVKLNDVAFLQTHKDYNIQDADLHSQITNILQKADQQAHQLQFVSSFLQKRHNLLFKEGTEDELFSLLPHCSPSSLPAVSVVGGRASFPVLFLYPQHAQCDFVESFLEDDFFADHLDRLFACQADWDVEGKYTSTCKVKLYMVKQSTGSLIEVDLEWQLLDVFKKGIITSYHRGLLAVHILPKDNHSEFTGRFKQ